jgi:hypothetical protein
VENEYRKASREQPSVEVEGYGVHVCQIESDREIGGPWGVWLNTEVADFDGICLGVGTTRNEAVGKAVKLLEAVTDFLQGPPPTVDAAPSAPPVD